MGYTTTDKLSGKTGLGVGVKGSEVVVADSDGALHQKGTEVASTGAEIDLICDGNTATAAEVTRACDVSARVVATTATALSLTVTEHAERILLVNSNSTVANTFTLPVAAATGAKFTIINNIAQTQGTVVISANGTTDVLSGVAFLFGTTEETAESFVTSATSDKISLNLTTTGGALAGDRIEAIDTSANTWTVTVHSVASGSLATPFSAT